ncbi:MAG: formylglycine-generating enzyme family protein [Kiritimatiellia bacterium]|jgi:formylglycine-generating enzyme required for sulfatase activity
MKRIRHLSALLLPIAALGIARAADPVVSDVSMTWNATAREASIAYTLSNAPAVVTLDLVDSAGVSIGGEKIGGHARGDVFCKVAENGRRAIVWHPDTDLALLPADGVRAVVSAWSTSAPPAYLVAPLIEGAAASLEYYPSEDFLPGGLHANRRYKSDRLVMRRIEAAGVAWAMGTSDAEAAAIPGWTRPAAETPHAVTLDSDYYMAVFETTHAQYRCLTGGSMPPSVDNANFVVDGNDRPVEQAFYLHIRGATQWPDPPSATSPLGKLRTRTGIAFDLPSEAQWEFACRAGNAGATWGDGTAIAPTVIWYKEYDANGTPRYAANELVQASMPGRNATTGGLWLKPGTDEYYKVSPATTGPTNGTAIVGTTPPNSWGLHEMHGNVAELTLDYFKEDIAGLNGAVCSDPASGKRILRGGAFDTRSVLWCRPAARRSLTYTGNVNNDRYVYDIGFRVCCPIP